MGRRSLGLEKNVREKESFVFKDGGSLVMCMAEGNSWFKNTGGRSGTWWLEVLDLRCSRAHWERKSALGKLGEVSHGLRRKVHGAS